MCLFPNFIRNRRYNATKKNGFQPPSLEGVDPRTLLVPIGCGKCIECKKQRARQWQVRLNEEAKNWIYKYCVTLTFSNEELEQLCKETNLTELNAVATKAVRRFLERWRKIHKKSICHWLTTELGHQNTERIHLHGVMFSNELYTEEYIQNIWKYGHIRIGQWLGLKTINYLIKYVHKVDIDHKNYEQIVLCSKGIGKNYLNRYLVKKIHQFDEENTIEYYRLNNGAKINLPIYYRNKLWTEDERVKLWIHRLNKGERYVLGNKITDIDSEQGQTLYYRLLKVAQKTNLELGFGDDSQKWKKQDYNITLRMLNKLRKKDL